MKLTVASALLFTCLAAPYAMGQTAASPQSNPPASSADLPQQPLPPPASPPAPAADRPVSLKRLIPNILSDQKQIWTFPVRLGHGQDWIPTAGIIGATAALVAADPSEASWFHHTPAFHSFNNVFTSNVTMAGIIAAPVSMFAAGLIRKDPKMERTALFTGEALADTEIVATVLKDITNRARPRTIPVKGNYSDTWFEAGSPVTGGGGFPSGHTIAAFSVATIIARRYGNHRWVPFVAYGMAALVGFSRVSLSAHFLSDVFVGAALGYSISRFSVLRQ